MENPKATARPATLTEPPWEKIGIPDAAIGFDGIQRLGHATVGSMDGRYVGYPMEHVDRGNYGSDRHKPGTVLALSHVAMRDRIGMLRGARPILLMNSDAALSSIPITMKISAENKES